MHEMRQKYKEPEWKELAEIKSKIKNEKPVLTAKLLHQH